MYKGTWEFPINPLLSEDNEIFSFDPSGQLLSNCQIFKMTLKEHQLNCGSCWRTTWEFHTKAIGLQWCCLYTPSTSFLSTPIKRNRSSHKHLPRYDKVFQILRNFFLLIEHEYAAVGKKVIFATMRDVIDWMQAGSPSDHKEVYSLVPRNSIKISDLRNSVPISRCLMQSMLRLLITLRSVMDGTMMATENLTSTASTDADILNQRTKSRGSSPVLCVHSIIQRMTDLMKRTLETSRRGKANLDVLEMICHSTNDCRESCCKVWVFWRCRWRCYFFCFCQDQEHTIRSFAEMVFEIEPRSYRHHILLWHIPHNQQHVSCYSLKQQKNLFYRLQSQIVKFESTPENSKVDGLSVLRGIEIGGKILDKAAECIETDGETLKEACWKLSVYFSQTDAYNSVPV